MLFFNPIFFLNYRFLFLFSFAFLIIGDPPSSSDYIEPEENRRSIIYNTTYGFIDGENWVVPSRVWVHKERRWMQRLVSRLLNLTSDYTSDQIDILHKRLRDIAANSRSRRTVTIRFINDPEERSFRIENRIGEHPRTDRNGIITGNLKIPKDVAEELLDAQDSNKGWLTAEVTSGRYSGNGRIRLLEPEGLSVVSDIDDTIKITEIPAGARVVVRNTFFKEYAAAPIMNELYENWENASFHYVSGSPWQLYRSLANFLIGESGFPEGSFHMKNAHKNPLTISTWSDLTELVTNELLTFEQKISQISELFENFPGRKFILVGDSGERDPEVYREIENNYPDQVKEIIIRDVVNAREKNPDRLEGMTILPAPTVYRLNERVAEIEELLEAGEDVYE